MNYESAVSLHCDGSTVTATVDPEKLNKMTIISLSIDDCPSGDFNVTGYEVTTTYDRCAQNISQNDDIITQV